MITATQNQDVDAVLTALAHPIRRTILERLAGGEQIVTELVRPFDVSQPAISHHLKVLEEAGLIVRRVDGARRPRRLSLEGVAALDRWLDLLREALAANYDRLEALLSESDT